LITEIKIKKDNNLSDSLFKKYKIAANSIRSENVTDGGSGI
jgi:hypothetical protein